VRDNEYAGSFIVIEGPDGAGTTTQAKKLAGKLNGFYTKEPTDLRTGEIVQKLISSEESDPLEVAEAFARDREKHLEKEVIPRLEAGETVVSDRYYHSSMAYQPVMGASKETVMEMNEGFLRPDLTFILEVDPEVGMSRVEDRGGDDHIFENLSFQEKVSSRYGKLNADLKEKIIYIDATESIEKVSEKIEEIVKSRLYS